MAATNRIVTSLLAILLAVAAAIGAVEIVRYLLDQPTWVLPRDIAAQATALRWTDLVVGVVCVALVLLGLLLLLPAWRRGAPRTVPLAPTAHDVTAAADRRGLERLAGRVVTDTDGVSDASVTARRGKLVVDARTSVPQTGQVQSAVQHTVDELLAAVGPAKPVRTKVTVTGGRS